MQLYEIIGLTWKGVRMILIDYKDRRPIYEQVVEKMADLMVRGILPQDSQLPSVRSLAMELAINPNTIQRAYAELEREEGALWQKITGYWNRRRGRYTRSWKL